MAEQPPTPSSSHQIPESERQQEASVKKSRKKTRTYDEMFESMGAGENAGKRMKIVEPLKDVITADLFLHQKEGLAWLIERENSSGLPPFWEVAYGGFYENVLTNYITKNRPEPLRGGIFADDMGLGKTLTVLSLIAANRPGCVLLQPSLTSLLYHPPADGVDDGAEKSKNVKEAVEGVAKNKVEKLKNVKEVAEGVTFSAKKPKIDVESGGLGPKSTLIVCPPSVLSTWMAELEKHTRPGSLKVCLYHRKRTDNVEELQRFDIVLTTYNTISAEKNKGYSPIQQIEWWRIVLDEAQLLRDAASQQSRAIIDLKGKRRWAVTGSPIQNGSFDLFSLMIFLKFHPFSTLRYWQAFVKHPDQWNSSSGFTRLKALLRTISLRRTKESLIGNKNSVGLPQKTIETCFVEFSVEERKQYDCVKSKAKVEVDKFLCADSAMTNYSTVLHFILQLRQICNCLDLCHPSSSFEDASNNPELLTKMVSILQDGDDFDCPVCLSPPNETIITRCAHVFCKSCILEILQHLNPRCPICRNTLSKSDLFSTPLQPLDDDNPASSSAIAASSKISTLLKLLMSSREESPSIKSVVFSQFRKMLILLEKPLKAAGFGVLRLDGSMTAKKRSQVIKEFCDCGLGAATVLLASPKVAGAGINLMAASRVYLLEPWLNPDLEEQAMDRVHRIGQNEEVKVVRLIVRNSMEEKVLELQERKKDSARGAFGKDSKELKKMHVEDLRILMQL